MKNRKIVPQLVVSAAFIVVTLCATVFANNVHAGETGSLINKWRWAQYYDCLFSSGWLIDINVNSFSSKKVLKTLYDDMSGDVNLPSYKYGHESNSTSISCYKSIVGDDGWTGSLESYSSIKFSQSSEMESLMRSLGYLPDSETGLEKQFTIHASTQTARTDAVTAQTQWTNGEEDTVLITTSPNDNGTTTYSYSSSQFFHDIKVDFEDSNLVIYVEGSWLGDCTTPGEQKVTIPLQHDPVATRDLIEEALGNMTWYKTCHHDSAQEFYTIQTRYDFVVGEIVNMGDAGVYRYQYKDDYYSGASFVSQTYGGGALSELIPNNTEIYNLYLHYLQKVIPQDVQNRLTTTPTSTTNLTKIRLKASDGTFKDFYANFNGTSPSSITVYTLKTYQFNDDHSKKFPKIVAITMQDVIDWFNSVDTSTLGEVDLTDDDSGTISTTTTTTGGGEEDEAEGDPEEVACYRNAGSFGWIMCPTIFGLSGIGEKFYAVAEPFLQTNERIVEELGSQTSGIYQAWLVFRNIANVIFVIIFMFIIFSQLTGWGIDNYGIKKMLPKLILVAIIVNLSYIICAIAVDASNIVGQGVRGLFESVAQKVPDKGGLGNSATEAIGETVKKVVAFITTGGVGLAGVAIAAEISETGLFLIVPVVLFLLTLLASAFFAIIMLGLRQALIVILIVIAPVAFALSVLPNTEAIYKKWFSFAKGMLMVYPVVGAVIGAGYLTARILMNNDQGFIMTIVSGLLMSVPYFMIPSITRKALDAVGVIGTKLTGIGKTGVSKANHAIKGSDLYNNVRADDKASRAQRWMNKRGQKIQDDINSGKKVSMRRANKYARMAGLASSREQANINARSAQRQFNRLQGDGYTAAMSAAQRAEEDTAVKNFETLIENGDYKYGGSTNGVNFQDTEAIGKALEYELSQSESNIDANKIRALQNVLNRKGDGGRDAIFKAMSKAQSNAQRTGNSVSAAAIRAFSSNIMNNQSSYKSSHRSLYEFANATAVSGAGNIDDYKASGIAALTQDSFLNTDATQMGEYLKAYKNGSLQKEDRIHLEELAHGIANNPNVHGSIRKDDYDEALKTFAPDVDWSKVYNGEGNGLKVDHSHDAAMAVFQDRLNRKVADGTYTQEKANRLMDKAKHMFDKDRK